MRWGRRGLVAAVLLALGQLASAATSVLYLVPEERKAEVAAIAQHVAYALQARGVDPEDVSSLRFQVIRQDEKAVAQVRALLAQYRPRLLFVPTYYLLRNLQPLAERPPIVFEAYGSDLLQAMPVLTDPEAARATGVITEGRLEAKMLEFLRLADPRLRRVCAFGAPDDVADGDGITLGAAATVAGRTVRTLAIASLADLTQLLSTGQLSACEGFAIFVHRAIIDQPDRYINVISALGRPAVYGAGFLAKHGALITIDVDRSALREHTSDQIASLLAGSPLRALPVAGPDHYEVVVGVSAASALPTPLSKRILRRATRFHTD